MTLRIEVLSDAGEAEHRVAMRGPAIGNNFVPCRFERMTKVSDLEVYVALKLCRDLFQYSCSLHLSV